MGASSCLGSLADPETKAGPFTIKVDKLLRKFLQFHQVLPFLQFPFSHPFSDLQNASQVYSDGRDFLGGTALLCIGHADAVEISSPRAPQRWYMHFLRQCMTLSAKDKSKFETARISMVRDKQITGFTFSSLPASSTMAHRSRRAICSNSAVQLYVNRLLKADHALCIFHSVAVAPKLLWRLV